MTALLVTALGLLAAKGLLSSFERNLAQLALTQIDDVELAAAADGDYAGSHSCFPVAAEVRVTLENHLIKEVVLIKHTNGQGKGAEIIPEMVIEAQTLEVDSVSGATYSSKVILLAIRDALLKAAPNS